jgi:subtilase family serine protease
MGPNTGAGQTVGLAEFAGYAASDVSLYFSNIHQTNNVPIDNIVVDGGSATTWNNANNEGEVCLDIEQAVSVAPGLSQLRVYIGPESFGVGVDGYIFSRMATDNVAKQLSNSWWWSPDDPATDDPYFEEMATQGQTFFTLSGDYGAYTGNSLDDMGYPAEDVHVTVVGGTALTTAGAGDAWQSEVVWNDYGEGGGGGPADDGTTHFAIQSWQSPVINSSNGGSTTLRNSPDVALQADFDNYICYDRGSCAEDWGGTSFATPRWAAWLALVNQQLVANGQAAGLGFINPTLYSIGQGSSYNSDFHDITSGNNDTNGQSKFYNAVIGYDLTTGWGSMNGQPLMAALSADFSVSTSTLSPETVSPGQSATSNLDVTAVGGFNNSVSLTCSVSPSPQLAPQCSVTPSSVIPGTPATLTVTTTAPTMALSTPLGRSCVFYAFSLLLFGVTSIKIKFGSARARDRKLLVLLFAALLITGLVFQAACGGGSGGGSQGGSIGTPAGNYTITVAGTSGSLHNTASVSLTVQ